MKKILLISILFLITGCVNYVELADIEVIENLAIDYYDNKYKIAVTTVKKEEEKKYETKYSEGKTLTEAIQHLKTKENKKIYIAHLNLLLLTENVVNNNLEDIIKFFLNNSESRNDFDVALTKNINVLEEAKDIKRQIKIIEEDLATTKSILFEEFLGDILDEKVTYLPTVTENDNIEGITLIKTFKENIKISNEETILYNFVMGNIKQTVFNEIPILSCTTTESFKDRTLNIEINITASINDTKIEKTLENSIINMYEKYKNNNIDIFNIEEKICNKNEQYCKKNKILEKTKFNVNVNLENKNTNNMEVNFK